MEWECTSGLMVGSTRESILRTRSMVMVNTNGAMVICIKGNGQTENRMDMASTFMNKSSFDMPNGKMDKEFNGLMILISLRK
jgi:hypothetical protein